MTLTGSDLGATATGFEQNFAWGAIEVAAGETLLLEPADPGDALYVHALQLDGAASSADLGAYVADHLINYDGLHPANVYYDASDAANAYLEDRMYALGNGGVLAPVNTPEPTCLSAAAFLAAGFLRRRRRCGAH